MNDHILVRSYYAVIDELGKAPAIDHRRTQMERTLRELGDSSEPTGPQQHFLCELFPAPAYESVPLERRVQYPPVTPVTDAAPKYWADDPEGPIECVPTTHARRLEHILDQYLEIHERWQAVFSKYIPSSKWMIEPEEADAFVAGLLRSREVGESPSPEKDRETACTGVTDLQAKGESAKPPGSESPPYRDTRFLRRLEESPSKDTSEPTS